MEHQQLKRLSFAILATATAVALSGCSLLTSFNESLVAQINPLAQEDSVFDVKTGDCVLTDSMTDDEVLSIPIVPCSEPHDDEAYFAFDLDLPAFPGTETTNNLADEGCLDEFAGFVGIEYQNSELFQWSLFPTSESWSNGDREVLCMIYDPESQTTGTLKNSMR